MIDQKIMSLLDIKVNDDDFIDMAYETMNKILSLDNASEYMKPLFKFIERHPNNFMGSPGPIVHFLEKFSENGYEELLIESVKRCPVYYNIWMMNRALNDVSDKRHDQYICIFNSLLSSNMVSQDIKNIIMDFLN